MKTRAVATTIEPQETRDGAGVRLRRTIASRALDYLDPFLLLDHFGSENPEDYAAGFPLHPHRGIETVTYMLDGSVKHRDSTGREGVIGKGDVQWMSAGRAILHEEMPQVSPTGNFGFQLWVNLPKSQKMMKPRYQEFRAPEIPEVMHDGSRIKIVAGEVDGVKGAVTDIAAQPTYLDVHMPAGKRFTHPVPIGHAAFAYLYEGDASFGDGGRARPRAAPGRVRRRRRGHGGVARRAGALPPGLRRADRRTGRALGPVRHEHARGDRGDARRSCATAGSSTWRTSADRRMAFRSVSRGRRDAAAVAAIYAPAVIGRATSFEYEPPDAAEMARRMAQDAPVASPGSSPSTAARWSATLTAAGTRSATPTPGRSTSRCTSAPTVHRAGVGRGLYTALFAILALQGYRTAFAGATLPNPGSVGLHTAMGFRPVGVYEGVGYKLGRWHDVAWFTRPLGPREPDAAGPAADRRGRTAARVRRRARHRRRLHEGRRQLVILTHPAIRGLPPRVPALRRPRDRERRPGRARRADRRSARRPRGRPAGARDLPLRDGKWSVRQVLGHMVDTERLFGYRMLCIGRGDTQGLPGLRGGRLCRPRAGHDRMPPRRPARGVRARPACERAAARGFDDPAWARVGTANGNSIVARACPYIMVGHVRHHLAVLADKYGVPR